jgi:hypothetical protein
MDEEHLRNVFADQMAAGFIVELLLVDKLKSWPVEIRAQLVQAMRQSGRRTDQFAGAARNEAEAELLADVTVRMHRALDGYLDRALARLEAGEAVES